MKNENLVQALKELGISQTEIRNLLFFSLSTKDRQEQMLDWIHANKENCTLESIQKAAQASLNGFLSQNPYNITTKNMPVPKWTPPLVEKQAPAKPAPKKEPDARAVTPEPVSNDPFDVVLQSFFAHR